MNSVLSMSTVGFICWSMMCGCVSSTTHTEHSRAGSCTNLKDLGKALRVLLTVRTAEWSADTIISIFDELICTQ